MCRAAKYYPLSTNRRQASARAPLPFPRRLWSLIIPIVLAFPALWSYAEDEFVGVRSYDGNFLITAPDPTTAGWVAKAAELTREKLFGLLGHKSEWAQPATIILRATKQKTEAGELELWTLSTAKEGFKIVNADVYPNKRDDVVVLQLVSLCLADIAGLPQTGTDGFGRIPIPVWLSCGVAENLSPTNLLRIRSYVAEVVRSEKSLPVEELFQTQSLPLDESKNELFFKESASVVDFLLHREDGSSRLRQAIGRFRQERDFTASLLFAFSRDFTSLAQLRDQWRAFAVQQAERIVGAPKMPLSETKGALARVLIVEILTVDQSSLEEKVVTTDLPGLFRHRNKRLVQQIASEKASDVFRLSLRAAPEYALVLQEYLEALTAIARNDRPEFKRHFALAERLRKKVEESPDFKNEETGNANPGNE